MKPLLCERSTSMNFNFDARSLSPVFEKWYLSCGCCQNKLHLLKLKCLSFCCLQPSHHMRYIWPTTQSNCNTALSFFFATTHLDLFSFFKRLQIKNDICCYRSCCNVNSLILKVSWNRYNFIEFVLSETWFKSLFV